MSIYTDDIVNFITCNECIDEDLNPNNLAVSITIDNEILISCPIHLKHIAKFELKHDIVSSLIERGCDCCKQEE